MNWTWMCLLWSYAQCNICVCLRVRGICPQTSYWWDLSFSISVTTVPILPFCFHLSVIFIDCDLCGCAECLSSCNTVIKAVLHFNTTVCFHRSLGLRLAPVCHVRSTSPRRTFWTRVASWCFQSDQEEGIQTECRLRFLTRSYNRSQTPAELFSLAPFVSCTPLCH